MEARAPQDLVGHPIADAGKALLHQQHGLDGCARAATQEGAHDSDRKIVREDRRRNLLPPRRHARTLPKEDPPKLPRIDEDELLPAAHGEHKVVVLGRLARRIAAFQPAGHPEVHADPRIARKAERHLLGGRERFQQFRAHERLGHRRPIDTATHARFRIQADLRDLAAEARIPAAAEIVDFGEFGHRLLFPTETESSRFARR